MGVACVEEKISFMSPSPVLFVFGLLEQTSVLCAFHFNCIDKPRKPTKLSGFVI